MISSRFRRKRPNLVPDWVRSGSFVIGSGSGVLVLVILLVVWRGCAHRSADVSAKWGGMSEKEWREQYEKREQADAKKGAEAAKLADTQKKKAAAAEQKRLAESKRKTVAGSGAKFLADGGKIPEEKLTSGAPRVTPVDASAPPRLPEDYSQWNDMDFFEARLAGDPRLAVAVENRIKRVPQNEVEAVFLRKLLSPGSAPQLKNSARRKPARTGGRGGSPALPVIAAALARIGTPAARKTLSDMLAGTLCPEEDDAMAVAALQALAGNPSAENEDLLLAALIDAEKLRPSGQYRFTADKMRQETLGLIQKHGGSRIRLQAAQKFVDPKCPRDLRRLLAPLLQQSRPENIDAQVLVYESGLLEPAIRAAIEKGFVQQSDGALRQFLGIADDQTGPEQRSPYGVAIALWNPAFVAAVRDRHKEMASLQQGADAFLMAATVPAMGVRTRLLRTLERHWDEGPAGLEAAGWTKSIVGEPGVLVVLKSVRRSEAAPRARVPASRTSGQRRGAADSPDAANAADSRQQAENKWLAAEEALVREYCRRFRAAGLAWARASQRNNDAAEDEEPEPPVRLNPGASVATAYRVEWPGQHRARLPGASLDPMIVSYVRIEQKARLRSMQAYYERTVKPHQVHRLSDGIWLDGLVTGDKQGRARSIDVRVTTVNAKTDRPVDEPQELTVEILAVEIPALTVGTVAERRGAAESDLDAAP